MKGKQYKMIMSSLTNVSQHVTNTFTGLASAVRFKEPLRCMHGKLSGKTGSECSEAIVVYN